MILVTGATGHVGRHVTWLLHEGGAKVRAFVRGRGERADRYARRRRSRLLPLRARYR